MHDLTAIIVGNLQTLNTFRDNPDEFAIERFGWVIPVPIEVKVNPREGTRFNVGLVSAKKGNQPIIERDLLDLRLPPAEFLERLEELFKRFLDAVNAQMRKTK